MTTDTPTVTYLFYPKLVSSYSGRNLSIMLGDVEKNNFKNITTKVYKITHLSSLTKLETIFQLYAF